MAYVKLSGLSDSELQAILDKSEAYDAEVLARVRREIEKRKIRVDEQKFISGTKEEILTHEIREIKNSVNSIKNIMVFWLVVSILSVILSIVGVIASL